MVVVVMMAGRLGSLVASEPFLHLFQSEVCGRDGGLGGEATGCRIDFAIGYNL